MEVKGQECHLDLRHLLKNPILWMIIRNGGVLSCSILRSDAVRAAGLFVPGMHVSEDTDFLIRLFMHGGAARSESRPVRQIKAAPLESTEPPNLSSAYQDMPYLWASHRESVLPSLPAAFLEEHKRLIRISMAHRWAKAAFHCRDAFHIRRAIVSLAYALKWDNGWVRRA